MKKIRISASDIIFESGDYIALNKKQGWDSHDLEHSLRSFLKQRDRLDKTPFLKILFPLGTLHSGVILFSKQTGFSLNEDADFQIKAKLDKEYMEISVKDLENIIKNNEQVYIEKVVYKNISIEAKKNLNLLKSKTSKSTGNQYIIFNKPYNVLCQFTKQHESESALCDFNLPKEVYPAGRLDKDSEGLLLLTNDGQFINKMANPRFHKEKTYWVQVERIPTKEALLELSKGVVIKGGYKTRSCKLRMLSNLNIPERVPPIRERKNVPTCWLEIKITEGKNRQVRSMTAAIGHPTLRLIRVAIGNITLPEKLVPGEFQKINNPLKK